MTKHIQTRSSIAKKNAIYMTLCPSPTHKQQILPENAQTLACKLEMKKQTEK